MSSPEPPADPFAGYAGSAELLALGAAARELVAAVVRTNVPLETLRAATASLAEVTALLRQHQHDGVLPGTATVQAGRTPLNPVIGVVNPIAPPLRARIGADGAVTAHATLSSVYEGPPGWVHGGVSAMLLDTALGYAIAAAGEIGMTVTMSLRYRRPVPFDEELTVTARSAGRDGRAMFAAAEISAGGRVCVEATAEFRSPRPETVAAWEAAGAVKAAGGDSPAPEIPETDVSVGDVNSPTNAGSQPLRPLPRP